MLSPPTKTVEALALIKLHLVQAVALDLA